MTTKNSPVKALKAQAAKIAAHLKGNENGAASRVKPTFKAGVVMDDKVITIEMTWNLIRATEEAALAEYILGLMQERPDVAH